MELPDLLFGVATSDHQFESFDPERPDYRDVWEQRQKQTPRGRATDFWNRYPEDIQLARELDCKLFRFSIAWSRVEPKPGAWDKAALEHYRAVALEICKAGMMPLVTLHHFTWPIHVEERGGMTTADFPHWYAAYVSKVANCLGDLVPYWITFNEPNLLVYGYVKPWWQPFFLVPPGTAVGTSLAGQLGSSVQLIRNLLTVVGTVINSNWWHLGMAGKLPEFLCPAECVDTEDFLGLDYYWGISTLELHRMHQLIDASLSNFFGAPVDPPGLLRVLRRFHRWFPDKEILIIENGCIESADGFTRSQYLSSHLDQLKQARALGMPVRGYICWSLTSNREWGLKFDGNSDFGLYHIDLDTDPTLARKPTECVQVYKEAIQAMTGS